MDGREHENRLEALNNAVRHRLQTETPADIVEAAEKYLKFLQDNDGDAQVGDGG